MTIQASTPEEYITCAPPERQEALKKLRDTISGNLPEGFAEGMSYGLPGFVVPHSVYPDGYHCKPGEPLPFISFASQKNYIALYHMGLFANDSLLGWFKENYPNHCKTKLDMGKSCVRFKKIDDIPYDLIGELVTKVSCEEWIALYEKTIKR
jgi:hypothetical protein